MKKLHSELVQPRPKTIYHRTKLEAEKFLENFAYESAYEEVFEQLENHSSEVLMIEKICNEKNDIGYE